MQTITNQKSQQQKAELYNKKLAILEIEKFYLNNAPRECKIGLEYERLSLDKQTLKTAGYESVAKIIEHFCSIKKWELIYDNQTIIGAHDKHGTSISLEPGCQFELSLAPKNDIVAIDIEASRILDLLDKIADIYGIIFVGYGITPKTSVDEITLLNKRRYLIMNEYLPDCTRAELCTRMMRQTAGIQINVDYSDKKDAYNKLKLFNLILPFISALSSNSPIENDKYGEFKSSRSHIWRFTGEDRCNLFYKNIFNKKFFKYKNLFKNYISEILDVPMIFIERDSEYIPIKGKINFREFIKSGYCNYKARYEDYLTHQSLCFPDVRLKNYIEIRNHDSNSLEYALALCALYKGICLGDIDLLLKEFKYLNINDTDRYYTLASRCGLNFKIKNIEAWNIVLKIFDFANKHLNSKERIYLEPINKLIKQKKTPADILFDYDIKNAKELIDFI